MTNHLDPHPDAPSEHFHPNIEAVRLQLIAQTLLRLSAELKAHPHLFDTPEHIDYLRRCRSGLNNSKNALDTFVEEVRRANLISQGYDV